MTLKWLLKTEPDTFGWSDMVSKHVEPWDGVRNHQAAANLKAMAVGDKAFFYHSVTEKAIVGVVEIVRTAYPDKTDQTSRFVCVDVRALRPVPQPVTLAMIKADPLLQDMALIRQSRLSVVPLTPAHAARLCALAGLNNFDDCSTL